MGTRIRLLDGTGQGLGTPSFQATFPWRQRSSTTLRTGTGEPQHRLRVDASFHQIWGPFWKGTGVFRIGSWPFVMNPRTEVSRPHLGFRDETPRGPEISQGMSRLCGRRFAVPSPIISGKDSESAEAVSSPLQPILRVRQWELDPCQFYGLYISTGRGTVE
jgi:hypothetical protein